MADTRMYPIGKDTAKGFSRSGLSIDIGIAKNQRTRVTIAQINAGFTLLPAVPGVKWRMIDLVLIAVGGAVTGATDVRVLATQAAAGVALAIAAVAGMTQSTVLRAGSPFATAGTASIVVLANGASFMPNDANTAVTIGKTGGTGATATHVDAILTYVADAA